MWSDNTPRLLSRPVKLHWAGWETDTYRLQQAGWQLSAEQDIARDALRLAIQHPTHGAMGVSDPMEHRFRPLAPWDDHPLEVGLAMRMGRDVQIHHAGPVSAGFMAIDAMPQLERSRITRLEDLAHFAPQLTRTEQVVVPEETVDELLSRILEKQNAAKTAYFREQVASERASDGLPRHRFAAQIIAFRDAA